MDMIGIVLMSLLAISLHAMVISLIRFERRTRTNGHLITRVFSILEIATCLVYFINEILVECNLRRDYTFKHFQIAAYLGFGLLYFLMSITISIDRFLEVYLNIVYPVYLTERHFYIAFSFYLTCAGLQSCFLVLLDNKMFHIAECWSRKYGYPILDITSIGLTTGTYSYIFWRCSQRSVVPEYMKTIANRTNSIGGKRTSHTFTHRRMKLSCRQICRILLMFMSTVTSILPICLFIGNGWDFHRNMLYGFLAIFIKDGLLHMIFLENVRERLRTIVRPTRIQPMAGAEDVIYTLSCIKQTNSENKVKEWRENYLDKRISNAQAIHHHHHNSVFGCDAHNHHFTQCLEDA